MCQCSLGTATQSLPHLDTQPGYWNWVWDRLTGSTGLLPSACTIPCSRRCPHGCCSSKGFRWQETSLGMLLSWWVHRQPTQPDLVSRRQDGDRFMILKRWDSFSITVLSLLLCLCSMVLCFLQISWKVACVLLTFCSDGSSSCTWSSIVLPLTETACHFLSSTQRLAPLPVSASCVFEAQKKSLFEAASQTSLPQPCLLLILCSFCNCSLQLRAKLGWQQLLETHSPNCLGDTGTKLSCLKTIPPSAPQPPLCSPGDEPHGAETYQPMTASGIGVS